MADKADNFVYCQIIINLEKLSHSNAAKLEDRYPRQLLILILDFCLAANYHALMIGGIITET